ncbi:MAG: hypothetical protein ABEJ35_03800 [Halobacteriaceae archaeon]
MNMDHLILGVHGVVAVAFFLVAGFGVAAGEPILGAAVQGGMGLLVLVLGVALYRIRQRQ